MESSAGVQTQIQNTSIVFKIPRLSIPPCSISLAASTVLTRLILLQGPALKTTELQGDGGWPGAWRKPSGRQNDLKYALCLTQGYIQCPNKSSGTGIVKVKVVTCGSKAPLRSTSSNRYMTASSSSTILYHTARLSSTCLPTLASLRWGKRCCRSRDNSCFDVQHQSLR